MKYFGTDFRHLQGILPQALTQAAGDLNGAAIDTLITNAKPGPFKAATFVCLANNGASGTVTFRVQTSPDNSVWTDLTGATITIAQANEDKVGSITVSDLHGKARYLRVVANADTADAVAVAAAVHLAGAQQLPVAQEVAAYHVVV